MLAAVLLSILCAAGALAVPPRAPSLAGEHEPPITGLPPIIDDLVALIMAVVERIYEWIISHLFPGVAIDQHAVLQLRGLVRQAAPRIVSHLRAIYGGASEAQLAEILTQVEADLAAGAAPPPRLVAVLKPVLML